ncbi:unnamed protein product [Pedinophyceae sp. YPF-701]|nr:unnamed protein product [Pedinophyceae sp. YPF-701]
MTQPEEQETILQRMWARCGAVATSDAACTTSQEAVDALAREIDASEAELKEASAPQRLPCRFSTTVEEVNFMCLMGLLSFGSGYTPLIRERTGRGAFETTQFGCLGMLLSGSKLAAGDLATFNDFSFYQYFGLDTREEREVAPGIMASEPGPLAPLGREVVRAMHTAAEALRSRGHDSLGELVLAILDAGTPTAGALVEGLTQALPAFADATPVGGADVPLCSKAQHVALDLYLRFREEDERFDFPDVNQLSGPVGNLIPAVLAARGVLRPCPELAAAIEAEQLVPQGEKETAFRAAAVAALRAVSVRTTAAIPPWHVGRWLWMRYRRTRLEEPLLKRHLCRDTLAY